VALAARAVGHLLAALEVSWEDQEVQVKRIQWVLVVASWVVAEKEAREEHKERASWETAPCQVVLQTKADT